MRALTSAALANTIARTEIALASRLSGDRIVDLLFGQTQVVQESKSVSELEFRYEESGRFSMSGLATTHKGVAEIEDDKLCLNFDRPNDDLVCGFVVPIPSDDASDETYAFVSSEGVLPFSVWQYSLPDKPSIAVLPFTNMSGDESQEYFVDGMTDTLITDLSSIPELFVIARNTSFTYKGRAVDVKAAGRELGVKYILEGSVQRAGGRVRINAQLIDAQTGGHVWSDRLDRANEDIFALQDEAIAKIIAALPIVPAAPEETGAPTDNLEAYDLYLRGMETIHNLNLADLERSIAFFEKALEFDPEFTLAHTAHVWARVEIVKWQLSGEFDNLQKGTPSHLAWNAIAAARELDADIAIVRALEGRMRSYDYSRHDRFPHALELVREALALAPEDPEILMTYASLLSSSGTHARALEVMDEAYRLNPKPPARYSLEKAIILFHLGRYAEAVENSVRFEKEAPSSYFASWIMTPALAYLGRTDEAHAALGVLIRQRPELTLQMLAGLRLIPMKSNRDQRHFIDGFRIAGMPIYEGEADIDAERLEQDEIVTLLSGRTIAGQDYSSGIAWWFRQEADGAAERWDNNENQASGAFAVTDGWACWEWNVADDFRRCSRIYRYSDGGVEGAEQFLLVGADGLFTFHVDAPANN